MKKIDWRSERIDHKDGGIGYEVYSATEGCEPEEESFIRFEGVNAKRDVDVFMRGLTVPATQKQTPAIESDVPFRLSRAAEDVFMERKRQVMAEGWSPQHDDEHDAGELAAAGAAYAFNAADQLYPHSQGDGNNEQPIVWPWDSKWWKPKGPRRDLVRAAALLIAEIERLDRAEQSSRELGNSA
jgi:hypothetical protein